MVPRRYKLNNRGKIKEPLIKELSYARTSKTSKDPLFSAVIPQQRSYDTPQKSYLK